MTLADFAFGVTSGLVAGVVGSVLGLLLKNFFEEKFNPWYENRKYRGINVSGEWIAKHPDTPYPQDIHLKIAQSASKLNGDASYFNHKDNPGLESGKIEESRRFLFEGTVRDRFVRLNLTHEEPNRLGVVSYLLQVVGDGRTMEGLSSHYDLEKSNIQSGKIIFKRKNTK